MIYTNKHIILLLFSYGVTTTEDIHIYSFSLINFFSKITGLKIILSHFVFFRKQFDVALTGNVFISSLPERNN
jgi:hypothetical protein